MNKARSGEFTITREFLEDNMKELREVLADVLIVRAEYIYPTDTLHYVGICEEFDELKDGEKLPQYTVRLTKTVTDTLHGTTETKHEWIRNAGTT